MISRPDAQYLSQVRKFLFCPRPDKKRLTDKCRSFLEGFRQEEPEAGYHDIVANFGPPDNFAGALMAEMYPDAAQEVRERYIKRQKLWLRLAVGAAAVIAAVLIGYIIWVALHDATYVTRTPIVGG